MKRVHGKDRETRQTAAMTIRELLRETKVLVHVLVICFGIASWVDINGMWVELPILVTNLPEAWTLPSYITIVSQIANIGPIVFTLLVYCCKGRRLEKPTSGFIIVIGIIACLLLAFFWDQTTPLFGETHSTALFALSLALSLVDCTSSMAFLAFMASLKPLYMSSYFIGEGLSGMLPSLIALAQGAGSVICVNISSASANLSDGIWYNETQYTVYPRYESPRFSVKVFFFIVSGLMTLSFVSFLLINFHPYCKREHVKKVSYSVSSKSSHSIELDYCRVTKQSMNTGETFAIENQAYNGSVTFKTPEVDEDTWAESKSLSPYTYAYLLVLTAFINMQIVSFLLSIQTYTTLPYSLDTYHLSAIILNIANPVACFVNLVFPVVETMWITLLTLLGSVLSAYLISIAVYSPDSPLVGTDAGGPLAVTSWALVSFLLTYAKVGIATRLRRGGRKPLLWCGAFTQAGALIGSVVAFLLVNVYKVFQDAPSC